MHQLHPDLYYFNVYQVANMYVFRSQAGLCLIDTGLSANLPPVLEKNLAKIGHRLQDIRHIFITHAHVDHVGGLPALQAQLPTATTYSHAKEAPILAGKQLAVLPERESLTGFAHWMHPWLENKLFTPSRVDQTLTTGDHPVPELEVVELPGHALGQIGLYWREQNFLLGGDVLMGLFFNRLLTPLRAASPDWDAAKESIRKVAGMNLTGLGLGHGTPLTQNTAVRITAFAEKLTPRH